MNVSLYAMPGIRIPTQTEKIEIILFHACEYFKVQESQIKGKSRKREYVWPRQVSLYLICKYVNLSLTAIGEYFDRDHTTVIHSYNTACDMIETNDELRADVENVESRLKLTPIKRTSGLKKAA